MKTSLSALVALAVVFLFTGSAPAQAPAKSSSLSAVEGNRPRRRQRQSGYEAAFAGATPRRTVRCRGSPMGIVDLSGVWQGGGPVGDIAQGWPRAKPFRCCLRPRQLMETRQSKDDPEANCLPTGVPRIAPYPWRIVQTPTHIFFLFEGNIHSYRQIFMNGRSIRTIRTPPGTATRSASWDGDTLVVDTVGFNDKFWFDFRGHPHTEKLHTIERYTRKDLGTLEDKVTIDDPGDYSRPFTLTFTARLRPHEELMEYICQENQQDAQHLRGGPGLGNPGDPPTRPSK